MGIKVKFIIVISIIFGSIFFTGWNLGLNVKSLNNKGGNTPFPTFYNISRTGDFDWGEIEVISEPILGLNNNINNSENPKIAVEDDKIYVVWADKTDYNGAGGDIDIFYRYFDGNSWSEIQVISEPVLGQNCDIESSVAPDIAVENGKIYTVWHSSNNTNGAGNDLDIFFRCNLTGSSWEDIQVISEPIFGQNFNIETSGNPSIAVGNSTIHITWRDNNNTNGAGEDSDIFYRCNLTGTGWEPIQVISEPIIGYDLNTESSIGSAIAVENGKIYIVWQDSNNTNKASSISQDIDIFYRCNITGSFWEPIQVISEPIFGKDNNIMRSKFPDIKVENDKIYVCWEDDNNTNNAGTDSDIFYRCNLTGTRWENIQVISEPVQGLNLNFEDSRYSALAVENGRIYVVWHDANDTNGAGSDRDIFYRCKFIDYSWGKIQVISEPVRGNNYNVGTSIKPDIEINLGKSYVVWYDQNNTNSAGGDYDIFYRWIEDPSPLFLNQPYVTPTFGNTTTNFNFTSTYFQYNNIPPTEITVNINGTEYSMIEVDQADTNYADGKNYYYNIKNLDIGVHTYKFYVSDDTFTWLTPLVNNPTVYNTPPNITTEDNLTAFEDVYYEVNYEFEDIDVINVGQPIFWIFSTNANWLEFDPTTGILNGSPTNDDEGEYWINITISDTIDVDYTNFTLSVLGVNDPPKIITEDITIAAEDEFYEVDYDADDVDNTTGELNWKIITDAGWLAFDPITAIINGTPTNDDVGEYWVNISVDDTEYVDHSNFTLTVVNVNDPPRIITVDNITAIEDELYEIKYEAEDVDNAPYELNWDFATNAKWLIYDTTTLSIKGLPANDDVGDYWINVSVSDTEYIDYTNFTLTVVNTNDPPEITTEDKTNAVIDELYSVNYEAEDIDPTDDKLTWSLITNADDWLTIDTTTGWLNGVPSKNDFGTYLVNLSVTDSKSGWDHHNFTLQVSMENNAPELLNGSIGPSEGDIKTEFTFSVRYYDVDRQAPLFVQVVIDNKSYFMELQPGENAFNGTYKFTTTLSKGIHSYYFTASNGFETVKTDNSTTQEIKKVNEKSKHEMAWYWLILVVIVIIILLLAMSIFIYKKRKVAKIPTVRAELMHVPPRHIALPGEIPSTERAKPLPTMPIVTEQLPAPNSQAQPAGTTPGEKVLGPSLALIPVKTQFQLPQATLSMAQKLGLLQERFLRGEVNQETYKKLRLEIEGSPDKDITDIDKELEEPPAISEQQFKLSSEPITIEASPTSTPELVGKPPQQTVIEPKPVVQQPEAVPQNATVLQPNKHTQKLSQRPELEIGDQQQQPQSPQQQPQLVAQDHQKLKPIKNGKSIDE